MLGVEVFETAFNELRNQYAGLTKDVYFVSPQQMSQATDLLDICKVSYDEKLVFNENTADVSGYSTEGAGGVTINFLFAGKGRSAVFVNENCLPEGTREDVVWLWRYNSLHHELMHALDFSKQKNFNTSLRSIDLVGAEAFADYKTLMHLKSKTSNKYMKVALQQYAACVVSKGSKGSIQTEIYNRLLRKIDSKTINYWATMEI